jgi:hypothetical protein
MIGDSDNVFAVVVSAETFELLDTDGNVVAEFGTLPAEPILWPTLPRYGIDMAHLDPGVLNSSLGWTVSTPANTTEDSQAVGLIGPSEPADVSRLEAPQVILRRYSSPPGALDQASAGIYGGRVNGSGQPIPYLELAGGAASSRATLSANHINLGAGTALELGAGETVHVQRHCENRRHGGVFNISAQPAGAFGIVPNTTFQLQINAGDRFKVTVQADLRVSPVGAGQADAGLQCGWFLDGVLVGGNLAFGWWDSTASGRTNAGSFVADYAGGFGAGGLRTFELRAGWFATGPVSPAAFIVGPHTSISVEVFRTHV